MLRMGYVLYRSLVVTYFGVYIRAFLTSIAIKGLMLTGFWVRCSKIQ